MSDQNHLAALTEYIERNKRILELSSPLIDNIRSSEHYRIHLQESFRMIREMLPLNNKALDEHFYPLIRSEERLSSSDVEALRTFGLMINDAESMENIDLPLLERLSKRILADAESGGDQEQLILALDGLVISSYMMHSLTSRLVPDNDDSFRYRDEGLEAALRLLEYLDKDAFRALPTEECRELVLINSRYIRALFTWDDLTEKEERNAEDLRLMRQALQLMEEPFYRELVPAYDWDIHKFRTLQYLADFTEYNNSNRFSLEQLKEINVYTGRLLEFMQQHPELEDRCPVVEQEVYRLRNAHLAGLLPVEEYRKELITLMRQRDKGDFTSRSMFVFFVIPFEYILTLDPAHLTKEQESVIAEIYREVAGYAYRMPKTGVLSFMVSFISELLKQYLEVPGGIDFPNMCMKLMAAMHPPTYVHSLGVAILSRFLAEHLIEKEPERFIGVKGAADVSDVLQKKEAILDFVYNGALLHDVGKLFIIETIMTYGRRLLDEEFDLVKSHPDVGATLLERISSTEQYADIARGHHR